MNKPAELADEPLCTLRTKAKAGYLVYFVRESGIAAIVQLTRSWPSAWKFHRPKSVRLPVPFDRGYGLYCTCPKHAGYLTFISVALHEVQMGITAACNWYTYSCRIIVWMHVVRGPTPIGWWTSLFVTMKTNDVINNIRKLPKVA